MHHLPSQPGRHRSRSVTPDHGIACGHGITHHCGATMTSTEYVTSQVTMAPPANMASPFQDHIMLIRNFANSLSLFTQSGRRQ